MVDSLARMEELVRRCNAGGFFLSDLPKPRQPREDYGDDPDSDRSLEGYQPSENRASGGTLPE